MNSKQNSKLIRISKRIHRFMAPGLFFLFIFISITGLLLGWKKNSNGLLLPESYKGVSTDIEEWLPLDSLQRIAFRVIDDSLRISVSKEVKRIDARPSKGMIKFVFIDHFLEVQLDATTGKVLYLGKRYSDMIENIHDGSIVDYVIKDDKGYFKLIYTSLMGISLLLFTLTGFWLWYGPSLIRRWNARRRKQ